MARILRENRLRASHFSCLKALTAHAGVSFCVHVMIAGLCVNISLSYNIELIK